MTDQSGMYGYNEVAAKLGLCENSVRKQVKIGAIPKPSTFGGSVRWSKAVIDKWIEEGCPQPPKSKAK